jgi:LPXTG-motif cell wall-anchored protein
MKIARLLHCFIAVLLLFVFSPLTVKAARAATFSLSPATQVVTVGDEFQVAVMIDTEDEAVVGADAIINYDGLKLQATEASLGSLFSVKTTEDASSSGKIIFQAEGATATETFTGTGTFATITFKALAAGVVTVTFDFSQGAETDSNIYNSGNVDVLTTASSGTYTVATSGIGGETSSPAPLPSSLPQTGVVENTIGLLAGGLLFLGAGVFFGLLNWRRA